MRVGTQRYWDDVTEGESIPSMSDTISYHRVVMGATATWTFFGGHLNPEYARYQGQQTIYLPTGAVQGLIDRFVLQWAGPEAFLCRRRMSMRGSIFADQEITWEGSVASKRVAVHGDRERKLVDVTVELKDRDGRVLVPAEVSVELPTAERR